MHTYIHYTVPKSTSESQAH